MGAGIKVPPMGRMRATCGSSGTRVPQATLAPILPRGTAFEQSAAMCQWCIWPLSAHTKHAGKGQEF